MPYSAVWGSMAFQVWELFAVYYHTWADPFYGREEPAFRVRRGDFGNSATALDAERPEKMIAVAEFPKRSG